MKVCPVPLKYDESKRQIHSVRLGINRIDQLLYYHQFISKLSSTIQHAGKCAILYQFELKLIRLSLFYKVALIVLALAAVASASQSYDYKPAYPAKPAYKDNYDYVRYYYLTNHKSSY